MLVMTLSHINKATRTLLDTIKYDKQMKIKEQIEYTYNLITLCVLPMMIKFAATLNYEIIE